MAYGTKDHERNTAVMDVPATNTGPDGNLTAQAALVALVDPVTGLPAGAVSGGYDVPVTVERPANATPYTAGDVVGGAFEIPLIGRAASPIIITTGELEIDVAAVPSGMTSFRLYLYSVTPPSAIADNAAWDLPSGDRASYLGYVDLGTPVDLGSTLYVRTDQINAQFRTVTTSLFAYLVTNGGFTPAGNSEVYKPTLHSVNV